MAITYTLKSFDTSPTSDISNLTTLTDIDIEDIRFEQTVGEKMWLESGELTIETYTQISSADWIALYINNILAEVFDFRQVKYDEKRGKYTYNLFPIQKTFMDDLADTLIDYSADTEDWAYDIPNAELSIASFGVLVIDCQFRCPGRRRQYPDRNQYFRIPGFADGESDDKQITAAGLSYLCH
jgi:hypothetical protein